MDNQYVSLIDADAMAYRIENYNRAVKKALTIPSWLNQKAEKAGVNFSRILQAALKDCLGLDEKKGRFSNRLVCTEHFDCVGCDEQQETCFKERQFQFQ